MRRRFRAGAFLVGPVGPVGPIAGAPRAGAARGNAPQISALAARALRDRPSRGCALGGGACDTYQAVVPGSAFSVWIGFAAKAGLGAKRTSAATKAIRFGKLLRRLES